jgi:hypothetical protein
MARLRCFCPAFGARPTRWIWARLSRAGFFSRRPRKAGPQRSQKPNGRTSVRQFSTPFNTLQQFRQFTTFFRPACRGADSLTNGDKTAEIRRGAPLLARQETSLQRFSSFRFLETPFKVATAARNEGLGSRALPGTAKKCPSLRQFTSFHRLTTQMYLTRQISQEYYSINL